MEWKQLVGGVRHLLGPRNLGGRISRKGMGGEASASNPHVNLRAAKGEEPIDIERGKKIID